MRKSAIFCLVAGLISTGFVSCGKGTTQETDEKADSVAVDTVIVEKEPEKEPEKPVKKEKKTTTEVKKEESKTEAPKVEEVPTEIGASPDAVFFLDDSETETTPKYPDGEKALRKLLKKTLRKAGKGEKATFRASIVVKSDGTVGRVQFTACGYSDEYKPEIIAALQSLPPFTPGTKNGKAVDSWYYLNYKR